MSVDMEALNTIGLPTTAGEANKARGPQQAGQREGQQQSLRCMRERKHQRFMGPGRPTVHFALSQLFLLH